MSAPGNSSPENTIPEITPAEAQRLAAAGEVHLLDVREPSEWEAGHADGATHVPLGSLTPELAPAGKPVIAICRSGGRSGQATQLLSAAGVDARNMAGGMNAWSEAGLPVVTDAGGSGTVV